MNCTMAPTEQSTSGTEHIGPCWNRCGNVVRYSVDWEEEQPTCDECESDGEFGEVRVGEHDGETVYVCPVCGDGPHEKAIETGIESAPCENQDCIVDSYQWRVHP